MLLWEFWPSFFPVLGMCLTFPSWKFLFISSIPRYHHDTLWGGSFSFLFSFFIPLSTWWTLNVWRSCFSFPFLTFLKNSVLIFSPPQFFFFLSYCSFTDSLIFLIFTAYFLSNFGPIFWERFLELYFPSLLLNSFLKLLWFLVSKVLSWCLFPTPSLLASWMG